VPQDDGGIESAAIQGIQNVPRHGHMHFHQKTRLGAAHAPEKKWEFGAHHVMAYTDDQRPPFDGKRA